MKVRGLLGHSLSISKNSLSILAKTVNFFTTGVHRTRLAEGRQDQFLGSLALIVSLFFIASSGLSATQQDAAVLSCETAYSQFPNDIDIKVDDGTSTRLKSVPFANSLPVLPAVESSIRTLNSMPKDFKGLVLDLGPDKIEKIASQQRDFLMRLGNCFRLKGNGNLLFVPEISLPVVISTSAMEIIEKRAAPLIQASTHAARMSLVHFKRLDSIAELIENNKTVSLNELDDLAKLFDIRESDLEFRRETVRLMATNPARTRGFGGPQFLDYPGNIIVGIDVLMQALNGDKQFKDLTEAAAFAVVTEYNFTTPSGAGNNPQVAESRRRIVNALLKQGKLEAAALDFEESNFFTLGVPGVEGSLLRNAVEAHAKLWTNAARTNAPKRKEITVLVSPGEFNGAVADVAAQGQLHGFPVVQMRDMYMAEDGFVYLNTGSNPRNHPRVIGACMRIDPTSYMHHEDFPIGMTWDSKELLDLSVISRAMSLKLGRSIVLKNGVQYAFRRNHHNRIIGVYLDPTTKQPLLMNSLYPLGVDPTRPNAPPGSLARAIEARKFFASNMTGPLFDAKDWTPRLAQAFGTKFDSELQTLGLAPLLTAKNYTDAELDEVLKKLDSNTITEQELNAIVIKGTVGSSGSAVFPLVRYGLAKKKSLLREALSPSKRKNNIFQMYVVPMSITKAHRDGIDSEAQWVAVTNDLRFYVVTLPDGSVKIYGALGRSAQPGSPWSNTGKGGGYFEVIGYDPSAGVMLVKRTFNIPGRTVAFDLPAEGRADVSQFLDFFVRITNTLETSSDSDAEFVLRNASALNPYSTNDMFQADALEILDHLRNAAMPYLPLNPDLGIHSIKKIVDDFKNGKSSFAQVKDELLQLKMRMLDVAQKDIKKQGAEFHYPAVARLIESYLAKPEAKLKLTAFSPSLTVDRRQARNQELVVKKLVKPEVVLGGEVRTAGDGRRYKVVAVGIVQSSTNPEISQMLSELQRMKIAVKSIRLWDTKTKAVADAFAASSFGRENERPVLYWDHGSPEALAALTHEFQHAKLWHSIYTLLRPSPITSGAEARQAAEKWAAQLQILNPQIRMQFTDFLTQNLSVEHTELGAVRLANRITRTWFVRVFDEGKANQDQKNAEHRSKHSFSEPRIEDEPPFNGGWSISSELYKFTYSFYNYALLKTPKTPEFNSNSYWAPDQSTLDRLYSDLSPYLIAMIKEGLALRRSAIQFNTNLARQMANSPLIASSYRMAASNYEKSNWLWMFFGNELGRATDSRVHVVLGDLYLRALLELKKTDSRYRFSEATIARERAQVLKLRQLTPNPMASSQAQQQQQ